VAEPRMQVQVFDTVEELQAEAARFIAGVLAPSSAGKPVRIALSGGSTPKRMHELLARADGIDWRNVHVYWGDERTVPPDSDESNYRMARETLLDRVDIPEEQIHRMRGETEPLHAADEYQRALRETFGIEPPELPRFDVNILGVGADGHTASLFPGTEALREQDRWVVANYVPQQDTWRITLTYPVINASRVIVFLVAGQDKAEALGRIFDPNEPDRPPAAFVAPTDGEVHWFLDKAAASRIPSDAR
jgi:6-phosphogluconolactonase